METYTLEDWIVVAIFGVIVAIGGVLFWRAAGDEVLALFSKPRRAQMKAKRERTLEAAFEAAEKERRWWEWVHAEKARFVREWAEYYEQRAEYDSRHAGGGSGGSSRSWARATDHYGDAHKALRRAWKGIIRDHGTECMERKCVMPSRKIAASTPGSDWHLAHDHAKGGKHDYLGPAHAECNMAESLARGKTWQGAPTLAELLSEVGYVGTAFEDALALLSEEPPTPPRELDPRHPEKPWEWHILNPF